MADDAHHLFGKQRPILRHGSLAVKFCLREQE